MLLVASVGGWIVAVLLIGGFLAVALFSYDQKRCPYCGYTGNRWKSTFPVCQRCQRDRT